MRLDYNFIRLWIALVIGLMAVLAFHLSSALTLVPNNSVVSPGSQACVLVSSNQTSPIRVFVSCIGSESYVTPGYYCFDIPEAINGSCPILATQDNKTVQTTLIVRPRIEPLSIITKKSYFNDENVVVSLKQKCSPVENVSIVGTNFTSKILLANNEWKNVSLGKLGVGTHSFTVYGCNTTNTFSVKVIERPKPKINITYSTFVQRTFEIIPGKPILFERVISIENLENSTQATNLTLEQPPDSLYCFVSEGIFSNGRLSISLHPKSSKRIVQICAYPPIEIKESRLNNRLTIDLSTNSNKTYSNLSFKIFAPNHIVITKNLDYIETNGTFKFFFKNFSKSYRIILEKPFEDFKKIGLKNILGVQKGRIEKIEKSEEKIFIQISNVSNANFVAFGFKFDKPVKSFVNIYAWEKTGKGFKFLPYSYKYDNKFIFFNSTKLPNENNVSKEIYIKLPDPSELEKLNIIKSPKTSKIVLSDMKSIEISTLDSSTISNISLSYVPNAILRNYTQIYPFLKFRLENVQGQATIRIKFPFEILPTFSYVKFDPITLGIREMNYRKIDPYTIELTIQDNGPFDENPAVGIIEDDSALVNSWWNISWKYRKPVNITYQGQGNLTDYQIPIILDTQSLISNNKMRSDCGDIRLTYWNSSSKTEVQIPYWIEKGCNTNETLIWTKVPLITNETYGNTTIFIYYSNPLATSESNGTQVFIVFDEFNSLSSWTQNTGSACQSISIDTTTFGQGVLKMITNNALTDTTTQCIVSKSTQLPSEFKIDVKIYTDNMGDTLAYFNAVTGPFYVFRFDARTGGSDLIGYYDNGLTILNQTTESQQNVWLNMQVVRRSGGEWFLYKGGTIKDLGVLELNATHTLTTSGSIALASGEGTGTVYFDNITIRKYVEPEPSVFVGLEEYVGLLNASITTPNNNAVLLRYENFWLNGTVYCVRSDCENVTVYLQYSNRSDAFEIVKASGTNFTTNNPFDCGPLNETNSPCNVSFSVIPQERGNYTLVLYANSTFPDVRPVYSNKINVSVYEETFIIDVSIEPSIQYKGGNVTISARLVDKLSLPIVGENLTFVDETENITIGNSTTDVNGIAKINYNIPTNASLGTHIINISYKGNYYLFYLGSSTTSQLKVSSSPQFHEINLSDKKLGIKEKQTIKVNVTDEIGLDYVIAEIKYPNNTLINYTMTFNTTTKLYEYTTGYLWSTGLYEIYIYANNTDGITNKSWREVFEVISIASIGFAPQRKEYRNFEMVYLSDYQENWEMPNYTYKLWINVSSPYSAKEVPAQLFVNTSDLISQGKMNANCSDISFVGIVKVYEAELQINNPYGTDKLGFTFPIVITDTELLTKMSPSGNDVRIFTYKPSDPYAEVPDVPFWVEKVDLSEAIIWVKTDLPASGKTLYLYVGNRSAPPLSNYTSTFTTIVGEAGIVFHNSTFVPFNYLSGYSDVAVFASITSYEGTNEAFTRIMLINQTGFNVTIQESISLDQTHVFENISWMAVRKGNWIVGGKMWLVGNNSTNSNYILVQFPYSFDKDPVVLSQLQTINDLTPAKTRMNNPSTLSFSVKVEPGGTGDAYTTNEDIAWIALEEGEYPIDIYLYAGRKYHNQPSDVSTTAGWTLYNIPTAPTTPAVIAKIMTENGGDNSHERIRNVGISSFEYAIEEEAGFDGVHTYEWNGYIAVEPNKPIYGTPLYSPWPSATINNKRIISTDLTYLDHYLVDGCNTTNTEIWVKIDPVEPGNDMIYMFYGNPNDLDVENTIANELNVFTYQNTYCSYVVLGIGGSNLEIASYTNSNLIENGATSLTLNAQQTGTITSPTAGTKVCSKGPISSGTTSGGDGAPLTPVTFKGKLFVIPLARYDPMILDFYALENANITVYVSNPQGSAWTLVESFILSRDSYTSKSYTGTDTDIVPELTYLINSTGDILVFFRANVDDYMPLVPASTELYTTPTNYMVIGAIYDNTNVVVYYSDGTSSTFLLNAGSATYVGPSGADGTAPTARLVSDKPIFAYQIADSDGTEATPALPPHLMDRIFVFPQDAQYMVVITQTGKVTTCTLYDTNNNVVQSWTATPTDPYPGKISLGTGQDTTTNIFAGYKLECNESVMVIYEQSLNSAETLLYGAKEHSKDDLYVNATATYIEEDVFSNIENNDLQEVLRGYVFAIIQKYDAATSSWINIPPAVINDRGQNILRVINPGEALNLTYLWDFYGAWNTSREESGLYRILVRFEDEFGNVISDSFGNSLEYFSTFRIIDSVLDIKNITYDNIFVHNINEYEAGDVIEWVYTEVNVTNNTALNLTINLTLLDKNNNYAGFGPKDTFDCGDVPENSICQANFSNSSNGYAIPTTLSITSDNFTLEVKAKAINSKLYIDNTTLITIHNIPSTFSSVMNPNRIYTDGSGTYYNFTMTNLWSRNITQLTVTINCPSLTGLNCSCVSSPSNNYCYIGNLSSLQSTTVSFYISANSSTPTGDYLVSVNVSYVNPTNNLKQWNRVEERTLEIRRFGIIEINPVVYPTKVTRNESFEFRTYGNNTGTQTPSLAWLAYEIFPNTWQITQGQQNVTVNNLNPGQIFWNNVTFFANISSKLGPQIVNITSGSDLDQRDFKVLTVEVWANTTLELLLNDSDASIGEVVEITAKLKYDNGTVIPGETIGFYDITENSLIGSDITDANGIAKVLYNLSGISTGTHTIKANFSGDSQLYLNPVENTTILEVGLKPKINEFTITPTITGYRQIVNFRANITDDKGIQNVELIITRPDSTTEIYQMVNISPDIYEFNYTTPWINGTYNVELRAIDSSGSIQSNYSNFDVKISAEIVATTEKSEYNVTESVGLKQAPQFNLKYRMNFTIQSNESVNIEEYQIMLVVDTASLISQGKMKSDCSDIRIAWLNKTSNQEELISYYLDYGCNTNETVIWAKVPIVYANDNTTIIMYYGSENVASNSDYYRTFTFEQSNATTFWVVSFLSSSSNIDIQAFLPDTWVTVGATTQLVQNNAPTTFTATNNPAATIAHDKPIYGAFSNDVTDAIHPISWAGKRFAYYILRGTNEWYVCAPFGAASVSIYDGTTLVSSNVVNANSCANMSVDITDTSVVLIESNESILVQHAAPAQNYDSRLLYPVAKKVYGIPSQYLQIAAIEDNTNVNVYCSDGLVFSWTLNRGQGVSQSGFGSEGTAPACVVEADKPIGALQIADSDGTETTTFLPLEELDRVYVFPQGVQYIAIAVPFNDTQCTLYNPDGSVYGTGVASPIGKAPGKLYFGSTVDGTNIQAGSKLECNKPVFAYYEKGTVSDETQLFGPKANRKYSPRISVISVSQEEVSGSAIFSYQYNYSAYIEAWVEKNESNGWVFVETLLNDTYLNNLRNFVENTVTDLSTIIPSWNPQGRTGEFRIVISIVDNKSKAINSTSGLMIAYAPFTVVQPPLKLNVSEIRIYEAPNNEHTGGTLVDSGVNKTFILKRNRVYRFEIVVDVASDSQIWNITLSNVTFENLNQSWIIDVNTNVWYKNQTDTTERLGGNFSSGNLKWNTSQNDGIAKNGTSAVFYFILNLSGAIEETRNVVFRIKDPNTEVASFNELQIITADDTPPYLYQNTYGLNTTSVIRGEAILAYARWNETINDALIEYNSTVSTLVNYTITLPSPNDYNWTNYTIQTTSLWLLGPHLARIYAADLAGNWNKTPEMWFNVYGLAYVEQIKLSNTQPIVNDIVEIACRVVDDTNSNAIPNYNVSFWLNNNLLGYNLTNSSGWAVYSYQFTNPGQYTIKCNITAQDWYKIDSRNSKETNIFVKELEPPYYVAQEYPLIAHKGDTVELKVRWKDNFELDYAILSTNVSGAWNNVSTYKLTGNDDWANISYTIPTSISDNYFYWMQYANDTSGNYNSTSIFVIEVWGWASVNNGYVNPSSIQLGDSTTMYCSIIDANTSSAIPNYNVSFWLNNNLLGYNLTNSSGWAVYTFTPTTTGTYDVKCNITDDVAKKYNASANNYATDILTVSPTADVTPPQIVNNNYGLNDTVVYRGESVLVYAQWNEAINYSWVEYNKTTSFITEAIPGPYTDNWTNKTLTTDNTWDPGIHYVKIYANDSSGNLNDTLDYLTFEMWGYSAVYWYAPNTSVYREITQIICMVKDYNTTQPIENYIVEFYNSTNFLGSNTTNSTGHAVLYYDLSNYNPGSETFYCRITNDNAKYYKAQITQVSKILTIKGKLNVTLLTPSNNDILERNVAYWFNSTVQDEFGNYVSGADVRWYINDSQIGNAENVSYTIPYNQPLGQVIVKVNATKTNYDPDEDFVNAYIYGHANVSMIEPQPGNYPSASSIDVSCRVQDRELGDGIANYTVSFFLNDTFLANVSTDASGYANYTLSTYNLFGQYYVKCQIYDNSTLFYLATVSQDNVSIYVYKDWDFEAASLEFNNSKPKEGEVIKIIANVSNNGNESATGVVVRLTRFFLNDTIWEVQNITDVTINLSGKEWKYVNFTWRAEIGTYKFNLTVDPSDSFNETNETNNFKENQVFISAWAIYYGKVNSTVILSDAAGNNFTVWIPYMQQGNLFFADTDSNFDFSALEPLNGSNDLAEADKALNMTPFEDSIKKLYDKNGDNVSDVTTCIEIAGSLKCGIPIINSTNNNSGNFITGILWDSSDGGSEYNGSQDLIFITTINANATGAFGVYDYEIRVPAYLRQLVGIQNTISIYIEIV